MNIRVNKKLIALLVTAGMGVYLVSCGGEEIEINADSMSLNDVIEEVEDNTEADEILNDIRVDYVNPLTGEYVKTTDLMEASLYLENIISLSEKLNEMGIKTVSKDDEYYYMVEQIASEYTPDDAGDIISDVYYGDDALKKLSIRRLEYYKSYLEEELRTNGINIASLLLENSIKSEVIDYYDLDHSDIGIVNIYGDKIIYGDDFVKFNLGDNLEILDNLKNIRDNKEEFDNEIGFNDLTIILRESFNLSKNILFHDTYYEVVKSKTKQ